MLKILFYWALCFVVVMLILAFIGAFLIRTPSATKRVSSRTTGRMNRTIKKASIPLYGKKGTGIYKNPKRAIKNKLYSTRTKKLF